MALVKNLIFVETLYNKRGPVWGHILGLEWIHQTRLQLKILKTAPDTGKYLFERRMPVLKPATILQRI